MTLGVNDDLDIERAGALVQYARATGLLDASENVDMTVLKGGVSARVVLLRSDRGSWVVKQALDKLRVVADWQCDPARVILESVALQWLERHTPPGTVPGYWFHDERHYLLGMSAVPQPRDTLKALILNGDPCQDRLRSLFKLLGIIHRAGRANLAELSTLLPEAAYFEQLRLEPYYTHSGERDTRAREFLGDLVTETKSIRQTFVHGDFSPKNVLVHGDRLVLVDHEVAHVGDPAFDIGFLVSHLLAKALHLEPIRAELLSTVRHAFEYYEQGAGDDPFPEHVQRRAVRHSLGCLLARVIGRSPLEYLSDGESGEQQEAAVALMAQPPSTLAELSDAFAELIR